jgi:hypothetical protein
MKKQLLIYVFVTILTCIAFRISAQVAVTTNGSAPDNSAMLDVKSTTKGALLPRMTMAQRNAILTPATSLMIYQTDVAPGYYYNAGTPASPSWLLVGGDLTLPYGGIISIDTIAFKVTNTSSGDVCRAIVGTVTTTTGNASGVMGESFAFFGRGVSGFARSSTGVNIGVKGTSVSSEGAGVVGLASSNSGVCYGIRGISYSSSGIGVYGNGSETGIASYSGYFEGPKFYIGGKVGIGTTNPDFPLVVMNPIVGSTEIASFRNLANDPLIKIRESSNGAGGFYIYDGLTPNTNTIFLYGNGNSFINSGNLGIGTDAPAYKLDVAGSVNLNKGYSSGIAIRCNGSEALWFNGTYFSWGIGGSYNYFGDEISIGTTAVPGYNLVVNGTAAKTDGGSWSVLSDLRLKNLAGNYDKGLNEISALQPVKFYYKEGNQFELASDQEQVGFVAQEVQKVFPEAVHETKDGYLGFNMHPVNVALVNAVKELKAENDRLRAENEQINARLSRIEALVSPAVIK